MILCLNANIFSFLIFDEQADEEDADKDEEDPTADHDAEKLEGLNLSILK